MIQARPWQVEKLDWEGPQGFCAADESRLLHRRHRLYPSQGARRVSGSAPGPRSRCSTGEVHLVRRVAGYKKIRYYSHDNVGYGDVRLPDQEMHTTAVWWQIATRRPWSRVLSAAGRLWTAFWAPPTRCTSWRRCSAWRKPATWVGQSATATQPGSRTSMPTVEGSSATPTAIRSPRGKGPAEFRPTVFLVRQLPRRDRTVGTPLRPTRTRDRRGPARRFQPVPAAAAAPPVSGPYWAATSDACSPRATLHCGC